MNSKRMSQKWSVEHIFNDAVRVGVAIKVLKVKYIITPSDGGLSQNILPQANLVFKFFKNLE